MKKLFLSMLTAILAVCTGYAQTSLVATLNHEGKITAYYGSNALSDAHTAAVNGDIITLSSGTFNACNITKAVTIRGAGMEYSDGMEPTILQNNFTVDVAKDDANVLTMEGIYHRNTMYLKLATKPVFFKCRFGFVNNYHTGSTGSIELKNASFIHCKISTCFYLNHNCSASFDNCVVYNPIKYDSSSYYNTIFYFTNCVLYFDGKVHYYISNNGFYGLISAISYSTLKNCVVYSEKETNFPSTTTMYRNVCNVDCFANSLNSTNSVVEDFSTLFKTWNPEDGYSDEEKFDLTATAVTKYVGDDGKQLGIYGGSLPFDPVPTHPKITKCDVAAKTTADGKLSVDIEVKGADY